ncbi:hypothetical protein MC885_014684 [Smutsia gigantea]|nr:hypothetical protein MC885_014684 [Smutsia gigantea]
MTTYRPIPNDGVDLATSCAARGAEVLPGPHTGDYAPVGFWVQNGGMPQPVVESPASATTRPSPTTPAVPKMGVRARVADWPPKPEALRDQNNPSPSQDTDGTKAQRVAHSMRSIQNGQPPASTPASSGSKAFHRLSRRRSKDVEFQDGWPRSPGRAFLPLRNRSSSEITLSECDVEDMGEPRGTRHMGALPLFREYGSTSSIDVQGVSEQSFFDILNEFRSEQPEARGSRNLPELLQADPGPHLPGGRSGATGDPRSGQPTKDNLLSLQPMKEKEKARKKPVRGLGSGDAVDSSIFRKLRSSKAEGDAGRSPGEVEEARGAAEAGRPWVCQKSFAHFDVQSMLFDLNEAAANRASTAQRRNTTTGASAASATASLPAPRAHGLGGPDPVFPSTKDLNCKENLEQDLGDDNSNDLLLSCPHFRNEIGGECERNVSFSRASGGAPGGGSGIEGRLPEPTRSAYRTNASISVLEVPKEQQRTQSRPRQYSIEHVDLGARYYQDYFVGKEHTNYFGVDEKLGPVALCQKHKVGILYCKAGQSSEEEMYNNEEAGPAFEEFLSLIGEKDYEIMFHVSTLLPYTPNNRQQEPGALPFTPRNIRSHFQHVFIIVRAHNPCTDSVCYSMAVTRSKDAPPFGPPIPSGTTFRKSDVFRDFLLAKVINAENAAHKSDKFHTMATRTRQEYLKDLAENCVSSTPIDSTGKFNLISLTSKKKEKTKARAGAEQHSSGAIAWRVAAQDYAQGVEIDCILGISNEFVLLLDLRTKEVVFNCYCGDVIGWTPDSSTLKIFYGRGDHIFVQAAEGSVEDIREIVQRLKVMTSGGETVDMTLRRNGLGQLGFHVKYDGTVAEVEDYGFAWQAGLRQGSRLVEICKVAVVTLSHDQMIDLLRTSVTVKVAIIPPFDDGTPRRGWPETYDMNTSESKTELESMPPGARPPYRSNAPWQWSGPASHNPLPASKWATPATPGHAQSLSRPPKQTSLVPFRESQPLHGKRYAAAPHPLLSFDPHFGHDGTSSGDSSSGGLTSQESTMERQKPEPLWHVPAQARLAATAGSSGSKHASRQDTAGKDSPNRHSKGEPQYSSHSSSNTLSSNASSSHSDDRWFDPLDPLEPEQDPLSKGGSSDSGIDTTLYTSSPSCMSLAKAPWPAKPHKPPGNMGLCGGGHEAAGQPHHADRQREVSPAPMAAGQSKGYRPKLYSSGSSTPTGLAGGTRDPPRQPSDMSSRAGYPAQVYKTASTETPRSSQLAQPSPFQLSASVPKSFFSKQPVRNKHPTGWKRTDEPPPRPLPFTDPKKQVDTNTKNVFGQPRLRASLRDLRSPRKNYKSTIEDDLKRLIVMDNLAPEQERDAGQSPQKSLQRTLSDESLCSGRREPSFANPASLEPSLPSDVLFTSTLPARRQHQHPHPPSGSGPSTSPATGNGFPEKKSSELSLADGRDRPLRRLDPGMMPLPDTAAGLEWSSLVNAAKAYEVQRAVSLFSLNDPALSPDVPPAHSPVHRHQSLDRGPPTPRTTPTMSEEPPLDLTGKVHQLEVMLKQLHTDLQKNNQRLQEESQAASEQLRKFAEIFCREKEL